jgi:hypothetical protein
VRKETHREPLSESSFRVTTKYGFIDAKGAFVIPPTLDEVEDFSCARALFVDGNKSGYIDQRGDVCIAPTFDFATSFLEGRALVCIGDRYADGKWGYIDTTGAWLIEPRFRNAGSFVEGYAPFMSDEQRWGLLDEAGRISIAPRFREAAYVQSGRVIARADTGQGVFTPNGDVVVPAEYMRVSDCGELIEAMAPDTTRVLFRTDGSRVGQLRVADNRSCTEGLIAVLAEKGGAWGYVDPSGEFVISPRFRDAYPFGAGRAIVVDAAGPAIIDREGTIVARIALGAPVRAASPFGKSGLASVDCYKLAVVASDGRVVLPLHLSGVHGLDEALVWVKYAPLD